MRRLIHSLQIAMIVILVSACVSPTMLGSAALVTAPPISSAQTAHEVDARTLHPEPGLSDPNCGFNGANGIEQEMLARINALTNHETPISILRNNAELGISITYSRI